MKTEVRVVRVIVVVVVVVAIARFGSQNCKVWLSRE